MTSFLIKRFVQLLEVLLIMSVVIFLLIYLIPGDPARVILGDGATPQAVTSLRTSMGLNLPLPVQYVKWLAGVFTGNLGHSYFFKESVTAILLSRIGPTLEIAVLALLIALLISVPLGIHAAIRRGRVADKTLTAVALVGVAIPGFVLSLLLIQVFAVNLGWLPASGYQEVSAGLWQNLRSIILPAFALGIVQASVIGRITRAAVADVVGSPYIRTAVAKGASQSRVTYGHVLRNALMPILTICAQSFGGLVAGAAIVETIFDIPGIGQLLVSAIDRRDYQVIQGVVLVTALMYVLLNLVVDLLYTAIDPRVRLKAV